MGMRPASQPAKQPTDLPLKASMILLMGVRNRLWSLVSTSMTLSSLIWLDLSYLKFPYCWQQEQQQQEQQE
ncbi:hypothetical protein AWZ03_006388 [Drosophila navojoa]|uniref:Uncharacterized protein n=1 Tax=Drosophila navojoa TaxID=7232 RepID=A0A484BEB6_DRONA|nr:hypothetical protein AWZ03_006388 [Drosophila navojoa]